MRRACVCYTASPHNAGLHLLNVLEESPLTRREWKTTELKIIKEMRPEASFAAIGKVLGRSAQAVHHAAKRYGIIKPAKVGRKPTMTEATVLESIRFRNTTDWSWSEIAEAVGYDGKDDTLRARCVDYCRKNNLTIRKGRGRPFGGAVKGSKRRART